MRRFGVDQVVEFATVEEHSAAFDTLVDCHSVAFVAAHRRRALRAGQRGGVGHPGPLSGLRVSHLNIGSYVETVTAELESAPESPGCSWVVPRCGDEAADGHQRRPSAD